MPIEFDYFEDYNEFDERIEKFKESIRKSVKEEIKQKLEKLEKENKELKEKNKNLDKLENEYKQKLKNFENEKNKIKSSLEYEYYSASLEKFLDVLFDKKELYSVTYKSIKLNKCPFCNEERKQTLIGLDGVNYVVDCKCNKYVKEYYSKEERYSLYIQKSEKSKDFRFKALIKRSYSDIELFGFGDDYHYENENLIIIEDLNLANLDKIKEKPFIYFTRKEDADEYARYLNNSIEEE